MTTEEVIEDSYFYTWVHEKGERIGLAKALSELLTARFGALAKAMKERILSTDAASLTRWIAESGTATSLDVRLR